MSGLKQSGAGGGRLARNLAHQLRRQILARNEPGEQLPPERELARRHRCAVSTVRAALAMLADKGLIQRVHGSGTYVADPLPQASRATGLLFFNTADTLLAATYYRDVLEGLLDATADTRQEVHLILGRQRYPSAITTALIDGLELDRFNSLVCLEIFNHEFLERLAERTVTVSVDFACHRPGVSSCVIDHAQSVELAVEQLRLLGHRRIGFAGNVQRGTTDPAHSHRLTAFEAAMEQRKLPVEADSLVPLTSTREAVIQAQVLADKPADQRLTALIVVDQQWQFIEALVRRGLRVPADLSVVGLGLPPPWLTHMGYVQRSRPAWGVGELIAGRPSDPLDPQLAPLRSMMLTGVALPFREMGAWAMGEVLRRQAEGGEGAFEVFKAQAVPGNTVAPPPA